MPVFRPPDITDAALDPVAAAVLRAFDQPGGFERFLRVVRSVEDADATPGETAGFVAGMLGRLANGLASDLPPGAAPLVLAAFPAPQPNEDRP